MNNRVMVVGVSNFRDMVGVIISATAGRRLVLLDALQNYPMVFDVRDLIWL